MSNYLLFFLGSHGTPLMIIKQTKTIERNAIYLLFFPSSSFSVFIKFPFPFQTNLEYCTLISVAEKWYVNNKRYFISLRETLQCFPLLHTP